MNTYIWDACEDCGSTDIQFIRDDSSEGLTRNLTIATCRSCGEVWEDCYEGMWND